MYRMSQEETKGIITLEPISEKHMIDQIEV